MQLKIRHKVIRFGLYFGGRTEFAEGIDVSCGRMKGVKKNSKVFDLSNWKNGRRLPEGQIWR